MRQYREWKVGDTCYWGKLKGKVMDIDEISDYPITCEFGEDFITRFTENGSYYQSYNDQSLSFLPNELCMPFEEASFLPPKYVVRAENDLQAGVLNKHAYKLYGRKVEGKITHHYHFPEFIYTGFTCCASDIVEEGYTLISFSDWVKMKLVDNIPDSYSIKANDKGEFIGERESHDPLSSIPKPIIKRMLHYQVKQGNPENLEVFKLSIVACAYKGGFDWDNTKEGQIKWSLALQEEDYKPLLKAIKKEKKLNKFKKNLLKMLK